MRLHPQVDRLLALPASLQADEHAAALARDEVGALDAQAAGARAGRIFTWPQPLVKREAGPIHSSPTPNQMPSTSLIGGVHTPPISPRVWKPAAG